MRFSGWFCCGVLSVVTALAAQAQLDAGYYDSVVAGQVSALLPLENVPIDPGSFVFQQFAEGSQTLGSPFEARVYFGHDGGSGCSLLGFTTDLSGHPTGQGGVVFPDASNPVVMTGGFMNLGLFAAGTLLDFYLIVDANHCVGPGILGVVSTLPGANSDGVPDHTVQLLQHTGVNGNTYFVYGFEDQPGLGDRDFNDVVFTLELTPVPEPSVFVLFLLSGLSFLAFRYCRRHSLVSNE